MFGSVGGAEFLVILVLALLLFGPRKLPQIGKSLGKALAEFRGATHEFKSALEHEVQVERIRSAPVAPAMAGPTDSSAPGASAPLGLAREAGAATGPLPDPDENREDARHSGAEPT